MRRGLIPFTAYALAATGGFAVAEAGAGPMVGVLVFWIGGALVCAGMVWLHLRYRNV